MYAMYYAMCPYYVIFKTTGINAVFLKIKGFNKKAYITLKILQRHTLVSTLHQWVAGVGR
jgi:hypothetical protein